MKREGKREREVMTRGIKIYLTMVSGATSTG